MSPLTFYILDVFAEKKYTGNQLAVFMGTPGLSDCEMQIVKDKKLLAVSGVRRQESEENNPQSSIHDRKSLQSSPLHYFNTP